MIVYLYRWRLKPDHVQQFALAWSTVTQQLLKAGSLGSRLHCGSDGIHYGYAQWPNEAARENAPSSEQMLNARAQMNAAILERFPEVVLHPLSDYLEPPLKEGPALNQVMIPCTDMDRSVAFYQDLDLTLIVRNDHYARFECPNGSTLSIKLPETQTHPGAATVYFEHQRLDEWIQKLKMKGVEFVRDAENMSWLWREAWLNDPFGNQLCLYYASVNRRFPPWRLDGP